MRWGPLGHRKNTVYFGGKTDNTWIGLAGSFNHIIGSNTGESDALRGDAIRFSRTFYDIQNALRDDMIKHDPPPILGIGI